MNRYATTSRSKVYHRMRIRRRSCFTPWFTSDLSLAWRTWCGVSMWLDEGRDKPPGGKRLCGNCERLGVEE